MMRAMQAALGVAAAGLASALAIAARSFWSERADYVRTAPTLLAGHPERTGIPGLRNVSFATADGTSIAAWYCPSQNRAAVVLVHGTGAERASLALETEFLAAAGFGVLTLDLPGQGSSEGRTRWGVPERQALRAAVDWLAGRGEVDGTRIGGFGLSMGAYVLIQAAVLDSRLRAVTLVSSPHDVVAQNWRATKRWGLLTQIPCYLALRLYGQSLDMMPKDVIGLIAPRAVFIVGGALDQLVPPFMARELYRVAADPKALWIVPRAHHADFAQVSGEEYRTRITQFFAGNLLE